MNGAQDMSALAQFEARLREVEDKIEIAELTARYNHTFDAQDAEGYADCWTEDGRMTHENGESHGGRDEFIHTTRRYAGQVVHVTTDAEVKIDGDRATQVVSLLFFTRKLDGTENKFFMSGRLHDELVRTPNGWRFYRRRTERDYSVQSAAQMLGI